MRITYLGGFNPDTDEEELCFTLEKLGNEVIKKDYLKDKPEEVIKSANESDIFIFNDCGVDMKQTDELNFLMGMTGTIALLKQITCKKVMIYSEKIVGIRDNFISRMAEFVDYIYLNDDNWVRRHSYSNIFPLHYGYTRMPEGEEREDYKCEVAIVGDVVKDMVDTIRYAKNQYGKELKVVDITSKKDMADLVASSKMIVVLKGINENFFWDRKVVDALSLGAFVICPRLHGLKEEGLKDGEHFAGYNNESEMLGTIDFFMKPESWEISENIAKNAEAFMAKENRFDYKVKSILELCNQK
ncbi:MAG: glycosyltransferase family protein [Candidatus Heimdallarchaeaceae archaeon]